MHETVVREELWIIRFFFCTAEFYGHFVFRDTENMSYVQVFGSSNIRFFITSMISFTKVNSIPQFPRCTQTH